MMKRATIAALASCALIGAACAQSTNVLGPSVTSVATSVNGSMATLASNPSRRQLTVCNNDASIKVTISTGSTSPVSLTTGIVLLSGNVATSCFTFGTGSKDGPGVGAAVNVISASGTPSVTFIEYY